jgi:two-component system, cell cycle sensor histidine kinase and response regulator CckA
MVQHDGWIGVESEVGRGTTFRAYFPRIKAVAAAPITEQGGPALRGGHEGILLVEDDVTVREIADAVLSSLGYRIFSAPNGLVALQVWQTHKQIIDLLITDLILPDGVTGRELALRLRDDNTKLPIIYMSGYSTKVAGGDFQMSEGINYLSKPFDLTSLAKIVRASLDRGATKVPFHPND